MISVLPSSCIKTFFICIDTNSSSALIIEVISAINNHDLSIPSKNIPRINLILNIIQADIVPVSDNRLRL